MHTAFAHKTSFVECGPFDAAWVCERYESARAALPNATFPQTCTYVHSLLDLTREFDVFLLDAFGVLNVGAQAIAGAPAAVAALQANKTVMVLTNGATMSAADANAKYASWGFEFAPSHVIASRDLLLAQLVQEPSDLLWGVAAPEHARLEQFPVRTVRLLEDPQAYARVDGFVLLSTNEWPQARQQHLVAALQARPRQVYVGNPDIAAPREYGFSIEPGFHAHNLATQCELAPTFFGKPFPNAFDEVKRRLKQINIDTIDPHRVAMVGDSLHTDILGGRAAGFRTVLVKNHGLFKGLDPEPFINASGIVPDFIATTT